MGLDRQTDFTGGLNTRIPAHKLPENMVQAATNVDFSHGDARPDTGIGGDGGGQKFYYEKGASWVGTDVANAYDILTISAGVTTIEANPTTNLGNPLTIQDTGIYQIGVISAFTADASNERLTTTLNPHGLIVNDTIVVTSSGDPVDLPAPLAVDTTYFVKTVPAVNQLTLSATEGGSEINITDAGTGTHTLTSVASVIVNDTELNLGSVNSFVEYNDDLYMGRNTFSFTATTVNAGDTITMSAEDVAKIIVSDGFVGTGIAPDAVVESIDFGTNIVTMDKENTASGSSISVTVNASPARIIDGILTKIYPLEIPTPVPFDVTVSQVAGTNTDRAVGHSVKFLTENYPIPLQWGIARFDDASGAEGGMSELSPIALSTANIASDGDASTGHTSVPALVKYRINKQDANSELYGKFALYRVGGTSAVIKKVQDVYLTSQTDGSPLSVSLTAGSANPAITVTGLPTGAEWKVKWFGYGAAAGTHRKYSAGGISSVTLGGTLTGYSSPPTVAIAASGTTGAITATAKAILTGTTLTNIIITEKGSGYDPSGSAPVVTISGSATGTAVIEPQTAQGESTLLSTTSAQSLFGSSSTHAVDLHFIVKFTSEAVSAVSGAPYSDDTREYLWASSNITGSTITGDNGAGHAGCGSFIDFTPPRALIEIEPIQDPTRIPYNLKHLTEFNNFFMGAVDTRLHISNYAKPNNFAIDGYLDFDGQITGLISRGGEAVVFTEYGVYRVYGNAHNEMRKVQVPTVHGVPVGGHNAITKIKDSIIYVSHSGICLFDGRAVKVLTDDLIQSFTNPSNNILENIGGVVDDVYYLLATGNDGWKVDMRQGLKICNSTNRASNFHYRGVNNRLYSEGGYIGGATIDNKYSFETRDFSGGNITAEKAYYTVYITGTDFSGTINIKCDGVEADTFTFSTPTTEFNRALSLSTARVANRASVEFEDCTGKISSVSIKYDELTELQKKRFNSITLTYTGTPEIIVKVDSIEKISAVTLASPGANNTGTSVLYFAPMTEGYLPHVIAEETETSRISGYVFDAVVI